MNIPKLTALAAKLREPETQGHFDLGIWFYGDHGRPLGEAIRVCGTSACVAGWAVTLEHPTWTCQDFDSFAETGRDILGLTEEQSDELFTPNKHDPRVRDSLITATMAADAIDGLIATSQVTWPKEIFFS